MICAQVNTQCHKSCARYTLGARYLYFKRNAEKFGVRVICKVRAIGRKIRYVLYECIAVMIMTCNQEPSSNFWQWHWLASQVLCAFPQSLQASFTVVLQVGYSFLPLPLSFFTLHTHTHTNKHTHTYIYIFTYLFIYIYILHGSISVL
jgi:hypothetical protein